MSAAADVLGVSISTLRRWQAAGKLVAEHTAGGHRRYDLAKPRGQLSSRSCKVAALALLGVSACHTGVGCGCAVSDVQEERAHQGGDEAQQRQAIETAHEAAR